MSLVLISACKNAFGVFADATGNNLVGVKVGDWVKYSISSTGPLGMSEDLDWIRVEVQNVSDTIVTVNEKIHFRNGNETVGVISADLRECSVGVNSHMAGFNTYIIAANHSVGDRIFIKGYENEDIFKFFINSTGSEKYLGTNRESFYSAWSSTIPFFEHPLNETIEYYWDKETGFLLENRFVAIVNYENSEPTIWLMKIVDTNLWETETKTDSQLALRQLGLLAFTGVTAGSVTIVAFVKRRPKTNRKM